MEIDDNLSKLAFDFFKETIQKQYDYFKHLTTLVTGSIMIIIALIKGVFQNLK